MTDAEVLDWLDATEVMDFTTAKNYNNGAEEFPTTEALRKLARARKLLIKLEFVCDGGRYCPECYLTRSSDHSSACIFFDMPRPK